MAKAAKAANPGAAPGKLAVGAPGSSLAPSGRVKNAKELRKLYGDIANSPDGADPTPLTLPKCVECAHCGWPVWPRDAKVATKKTYARAGIVRGPKKEKKPKAEGGEGAGEGGEAAGEEEDDGDSRDTVEQLTDQVEELEDKVKDLEESNELLEEQKQELEENLAEVKEELRVAEERIEILEESEERWQQKWMRMKRDNDRLLLYIDRMAMRREDLETDLKLYINETRRLNRLIAVRRRRRNLTFDNIEEELKYRDEQNVKGLVTRMWRTQALDDKLTREQHQLEARRKTEVYGLQTLVFSYWDRKIILDHTVARLKRRLKDAAHRYLERCLSGNKFPWAASHVMTAWTAVHQQVWTENRLEETSLVLAKRNKDLVHTEEHLEEVKEELGITKANEERLLQIEQELTSQVNFLKQEVEAAGEANLEAKMQAEREKEEAMRRAIAAQEAKLQAAREEWEEERLGLETEIKSLEGRLAMAESLAGGGGGGKSGQADEKWRVVDKGQGVLCVGCLTQLLHRKVQPLPPIDAVREGKKEVSTKLDKAKKAFFEGELGGMPNPDDEIHTAAFINKKDPYALTRLTMWPESVKAPKRQAGSAAHDDLGSPGSTMTRCSPKWPRVQPPDKLPPPQGRGKGLGRAVSTPAVKMKETFTRDFRQVFR